LHTGESIVPQNQMTSHFRDMNAAIPANAAKSDPVFPSRELFFGGR
jgi:adenosyl cobinamide kinase/adenosyl cobinamide phosphate guanylyltransferase